MTKMSCRECRDFCSEQFEKDKAQYKQCLEDNCRPECHKNKGFAQYIK